MTTPEKQQRDAELKQTLRLGQQSYKQAQYPGDLADDVGLIQEGIIARLMARRWPVVAGVAVAAAFVLAMSVWFATSTSSVPTTPPIVKNQTPSVEQQIVTASEPDPQRIAIQQNLIPTGLTPSDLNIIQRQAKGQYGSTLHGRRLPLLPRIVSLNVPSIALNGFTFPDFPVSPAQRMRQPTFPSSPSAPLRKALL